MSAITEEKATFENKFNTWYKDFLKQEENLNNEIKRAREDKFEKIEQARRETMAAIEEFEKAERNTLKKDKERVAF